MDGGVQGLGEARVDDRAVAALRHQRRGCQSRHFLHVAEGEEHDLSSAVVGKILDHFRFADLQQAGDLLEGHAFGRAARVADESRMFLVRGGEHHIDQLVLVLGRHGNQIGQAAQVRDIEQTVVGRTVVGRQARAVHAENHRQILQANVMVKAVVSPLEKRRVNRADGMESHGRHAGREDDGVFLGNANVVITFRHGLFQGFKAGAAGHGRRNADNRIVLLTELDHRGAENVLPVWRGAGFRRGSRAGLDVVRPGSVEFFRILNRDIVAFAFLGQDMQHDGQFGGFGVLQNIDQQRQIVAVYRADVTQAHFLKDDAAAVSAAPVRAQGTFRGLQRDFVDRAFESFFGLVCQPQGQFSFGQKFHQPLEILVQAVVGGMGDDPVQVTGDRSDVLGDAPLVVVENADEPPGGVGDVVERFKGNAIGQRRVAKDANDMLVAAALVPRRAHAKRRGQRRARVPRAVTVMLALGTQGKAVQAVGRANGVKTAFPAGEQFVYVALVAHVPDELVLRCGEDAMESDGQLDHAKVGAQMPSVFGENGDEFLADFLGQLLQLVQLQFLDMFRAVHHVEVSVHKQGRRGQWRDGVME